MQWFYRCFLVLATIGWGPVRGDLLNPTEIFSAPDTVETSAQNNRFAGLSHPNTTTWGRPQTATLLSAVVPGAGQIYNREYWKAPLAWALMGGTGYYLSLQQRQTNHFNAALDARLDNDPTTVDPYVNLYTPTQLLSLKNTARRSRDYAFLGIMAAWGFQVLDAHVGGHLYAFDVGRNLTLDAKIAPATTGLGLGLTLDLKRTTPSLP